MISFKPQTTGMIPFTPGKITPPPAPTDLESSLRAKGGYQAEVGAEQVAGAKKVAGSIATGSKSIETGLNKRSSPDLGTRLSGIGDIAKGVAQAGFGTFVGAGRAVLAPVSPIISKAIDWITPELKRENPVLSQAYDKIMPKVNELAQKHPESATLIGDMLNTALWMIPEAKGLSKAEEPLGEAFSKEALQTAKKDITELPGKVIPEKVTPSNVDEYIGKQYSKAFPSASKKSPALTTKQLGNNAEVVKLINENKGDVKYSNQAGVYDSGRAPETVLEHVQAVDQTADKIWNKMSNLLKEKNVSFSLDNVLAGIKKEMERVTSSGAEYKPLQELYDRYSKNPVVNSDQMNTFLRDLNNSSESFLKSGKDSPTAMANLKVANLMREQFDKTAQQVGIPEISLLRRQYGALTSTNGDLAKAMNKLLSSRGGGANQLANLFTGEEIGRGVLTLDPKALIHGLALQGTKKYLSWLFSPDRAIKGLYSKLEDVVSQGEIPRMKSPYTPQEKAGLPMVRGQESKATTPPVIELPGKIGGFDEPQAKNIGVGLNPPKEVPVPNAPEGNYLNIGMNEGLTNKPISEAQIRSALPKDVKILSSKIVKGDTENTFVPKLSRPLTDTEMTKLLTATKQKAIPQLSNGVGKMYGSNEWGDFNPEYFTGVKFKLKGKLK